MKDQQDPLQLLRMIGAGALKDVLGNQVEPGAQTPGATDEPVPALDRDLESLGGKLEGLEEMLRARDKTIDRDTARGAWVEDKYAPPASKQEWSPLQQELRLLSVGARAAGRFLVVNETKHDAEIHFDCHSPVDAGAIGWHHAIVTFEPSNLRLSSDAESIVKLTIDTQGMSIRRQRLEFAVDIRDASRRLLSKLWVEVRFAGELP